MWRLSHARERPSRPFLSCWEMESIFLNVLHLHPRAPWVGAPVQCRADLAGRTLPLKAGPAARLAPAAPPGTQGSSPTGPKWKTPESTAWRCPRAPGTVSAVIPASDLERPQASSTCVLRGREDWLPASSAPSRWTPQLRFCSPHSSSSQQLTRKQSVVYLFPHQIVASSG